MVCMCMFVFQNDPDTVLRCLTMCAELLKQMNIKTRIGPTISALMSSLVKQTNINIKIFDCNQTKNVDVALFERQQHCFFRFEVA